MEVISGFEGQDVAEFIAKAKEIWKKEGSKQRGAKVRYQLIIGTVSQRAVLVPTVSTKGGTEILVIWNLSQEAIKTIEEEAQKIELPVSTRPYLWFETPPAVLPNETRKS